MEKEIEKLKNKVFTLEVVLVLAFVLLFGTIGFLYYNYKQTFALYYYYTHDEKIEYKVVGSGGDLDHMTWFPIIPIPDSFEE